MGQAIAFNPCFSCNRKEMCHLCELEMRRSGAISTQEWISVEDRLPTEEENENGLVGIVNGGRKIMTLPIVR